MLSMRNVHCVILFHFSQCAPYNIDIYPVHSLKHIYVESAKCRLYMYEQRCAFKFCTVTLITYLRGVP